jgi:hypothetical protein
MRVELIRPVSYGPVLSEDEVFEDCRRHCDEFERSSPRPVREDVEVLSVLFGEDITEAQDLEAKLDNVRHLAEEQCAELLALEQAIRRHELENGGHSEKGK